MNLPALLLMVFTSGLFGGQTLPEQFMSAAFAPASPNTPRAIE